MAGVCSLHSPCLLRRNDQGYEVTCQIVWLSEHGAHRPSFVSFLEENIHRRKSVGRKSYRVSKNKCSLAQWSGGAYQLQVRLFGTQNKEPIFCFFLKENIQRRKSSGCKRYRVSKKNKITDASKNYIYGKADILSIHLSL